jgi:hypothetical protein
MRVELGELVDLEIYPGIPEDHKINLFHLHRAANLLATLSNLPVIINSPGLNRRRSGYRTREMQQSIYANKKSVPMGSLHLVGAAFDALDRDGKIQRWVLDNLEFLERQDFYCESFERTAGWLHLQILPSKSGKRFFLP